jgi:hypothetical protein
LITSGFPKVFLDEAPVETIPPYITYNDNVSTTPELDGDAMTVYLKGRKQFNLWQKTDAEDDTILPALVAALNGMLVRTDNDPFTSVVKVESVTRIEEPLDTGLIHHEVTVALAQPLATL